jgi:hypothetical protein
MSATSVEIRCPVGPGQLFMKIKSEGGKPQVVEGNLLELACRDCARNHRKKDPRVRRVLHLFALDGSLVETKVILRGL